MSRHLSSLMARALREGVPLSAHFELTHRCNERCVHCYVDLEDTRGELTTGEVRRILGELHAAGTLFLTFTGGEVFLRGDLPDLVRAARELGFALRVFTNATLVNAEHARLFREIGVLAVEVSLYAMDPEVHDGITRVPGSHARTVSGIRLLREHGVPVVVKAPILREAADEYRRVAAFAESVGARWRFDTHVFGRTDRDLSPLAHALDTELQRRVAADPLLAIAIPPGHGGPPGPHEAICATGRRVVSIDPRGFVYPCSGRFPPAGDLRRQSFREVWESSPLLLRLRNLEAADMDTCRDCDLWSWCSRCPLDAVDEDGGFFAVPRRTCTETHLRRRAWDEGPPELREKISSILEGELPGCDL